jgi:hypothetical protein
VFTEADMPGCVIEVPTGASEEAAVVGLALLSVNADIVIEGIMVVWFEIGVEVAIDDGISRQCL